MMHACSPFSGNRAGVKKRHVVGGGLLARACVANAGRAICCYSTKYFFFSSRISFSICQRLRNVTSFLLLANRLLGISII